MDPRELEVEWYRTNGKYPERIVREHGGKGREYVVGDWSWNRLHPDKPEFIEPQFTRFANSERA